MISVSALTVEKKSEDYEVTQEFLDKVRNSYDIEYIYMLVPLKKDGSDNMKYVMCGVRQDETVFRKFRKRQQSRN